MKNLTLCALLALAAALPAAAQSNDEALPPPSVSEHAERLVNPNADKKPGRQSGRRTYRLMNQALSGTIHDSDQGPLTVELDGVGALPAKGELVDLLSRRALGRELKLRVILELGSTDRPTAARIVSVQATARHDLPIFGPDSPLDIGTLPEGSTCWVSGGRKFAFMKSESGSGKVLLSGLQFGSVEAPREAQTVQGTLTQNGPSEAAPQLTQGGKTMPIVGPLVGLLREHAKNLRVRLQGRRTAEGFFVTAVRAVATRFTEIKDDQPVGNLNAGEEVWVTGGRTYVDVTSPSKGEGMVASSDLRFGERPASGVIDGLNDKD